MSDGAKLNAQLAVYADRQLKAGGLGPAGYVAGVAPADAEVVDLLKKGLSAHGHRFANCEPDGKRKVRVLANDRLFLISHYTNMTKPRTQQHYLREWREAANLTQDDLAALVGTSKSVISELENSKKGLSNKWLGRLAPHLKTTKGAILDFHPDWVDREMLDHFLGIGEADRPQALKILGTFPKRTGTDG